MRNPNEVAKLLKQRQTLKTIANGFKLVGQYEMAIAQYQTALKVEITPNSAPVLMLAIDKKYLDPELSAIFFEIAECKRLNKDYIQAYRDFQKLQILRSPVANVVDKIKQCELEITEHADKIFMQARDMLDNNKSTSEIKLQIEQCRMYYSEIKLNSSLALLAKFEVKLNWHEIKDSINQKAKAFISDLELASKQEAIDELVSVLINDARLLMRKYDFFEGFLSSEEIAMRNLLAGLIQLVAQNKSEPGRLAKNIMYIALKNNAFGYKNPILLERHADRLIEAIKQAFIDKWIKFEGLESAKIQKILEDVAEIITQDLEHTTLHKRWGNWSWAELYLKNSKGLPAIVADKITNFASEIMPAYIQLPMFPQRVIEVAANSDRPVI